LTVQETGIADAVLGRESLRGALAEVAGGYRSIVLSGRRRSASSSEASSSEPEDPFPEGFTLRDIWG
jgi:proline racemase